MVEHQRELLRRTFERHYVKGIFAQYSWLMFGLIGGGGISFPQRPR